VSNLIDLGWIVQWVEGDLGHTISLAALGIVTIVVLIWVLSRSR